MHRATAGNNGVDAGGVSTPELTPSGPRPGWAFAPGRRAAVTGRARPGSVGSMSETATAMSGEPLPMPGDPAVDYDGAARLAEHLITQMRNDGLVISGTTGESPTTSDEEKERLLRAVVEAVGSRATVVAGVGTYDTAHSCELARRAERAGANALLVVTPYYSKPPQAGLVAHFTAVADATGLPVMVYDIPGRTGTPIATETLIQLAQHPRIVAVKDAKGDLGAASVVMNATGLAFYCGDDILNLPWLSVGACGFVSVDAYLAGEVARALRLHRELLPVYTGMTRTQNVITTKAALAMLGLPAGPVRPPLVDATPAEAERLRADLVAGGVKLT